MGRRERQGNGDRTSGGRGLVPERRPKGNGPQQLRGVGGVTAAEKRRK